MKIKKFVEGISVHTYGRVGLYSAVVFSVVYLLLLNKFELALFMMAGFSLGHTLGEWKDTDED